MSEIEKQFFDTFGIEPKFKGYSNTEELSTGGVIPCGNIKYFNTIEEMDKANYWCFNMWELDKEDKEYPEITDRILLELICILNNYGKDIWACNIDSLRRAVLNKCINIIRTKDLSTITLDKFKHQVQALFKEDN